ncbi:DinB family protein [Gynurincola endophyticus]|jgi:uncharacterized damage-inducible protein DinB|uniref:DinB family protein n=1 Tax=Gynurincola endophyticus TaxID=2479004 RepID=UPI000F8F365F|nr:DinB family protein [Gynurincola endophyticus]
MSNAIFNKQEFLEIWLGNRKLTRRVIEVYPENELFSFTIGGMRDFGHLCAELLAIPVPSLKSIVNNKDAELYEKPSFANKEELLKLWDAAEKEIIDLYNQIPEERFNDQFLLFKTYDGIIKHHFIYFLENEIHHRGQAFVYLRALGIEPPFFWER